MKLNRMSLMNFGEVTRVFDQEKLQVLYTIQFDWYSLTLYKLEDRVFCNA